MNLPILAIQKALNNQWQEAASLNQQILLEDPLNIDAMNRLAQAYLNLGELSKAKQWYHQVLKTDRYNPIAKRNLQKLKSLQPNGTSMVIPSFCRPMNFIEEPGRTKVVFLVRLGERSVLSQLQPSTTLNLLIRSQSVCLYFNKLYVGRLPDDIGKRIIWLYQRENQYSVYVKSLEKNRVSVFIREILRSPQNQNFCSFQISDRSEQAASFMARL